MSTIPTDNQRSKSPGAGPPSEGSKLQPAFALLYAALRETAREVVEEVRKENEALLKRQAALDPLMRIEGVAETLGKSKRWCESALAQDELPPPIWIGGTRRWHPDSIDAYIRQQAGRAGR